MYIFKIYLQNICISLLNIRMIFDIKENLIHFDPYNVFLAIATNISMLLMTSFVDIYEQNKNLHNMDM